MEKISFFNKNILLAFGLLIIQQLIVASSTIWITRLITHIQNGNFSYLLLGLYLASLCLPYLPGAAALIEMAKAKVKANIRFINNFTNVYRGQIVEWTNSSQHSSKSSILTGEAPQAINGYLDYIYHFTSCGLNVLFNLLILAFIIEPWLLASVSLGVLLDFLILKAQKNWKKTLSLRAQQGRLKWTGMLLKAWDNILLANSYNFDIWHNKVFHRGNRLMGSHLKLESWSQSVSILMAFVLLAPSFILISYLSVINEYNLTKLAVMVVALPRLFQVLYYSYEMLFLLADFPMQKSRVKTVMNLLEAPNLFSSAEAYQKLEQRIHWSKINVTFDEKPLPPEVLIKAPLSVGKYTIKGENGSGKSSLLLLLKLIKENDAFYLPVKHDLAFYTSKSGQSTGQLMRKILSELLDKLEAPIVLLDEWDANLDIASRQKFSLLIDQLSQKKCVIEVCHR